jgi:hypothetical protein
MCTGVDKGFAGRKFSGSPRAYGLISDRMIREEIVIKNPTVSLIEKYG